MSLTKPDKPRHYASMVRNPADYLGWQDGAHVWWYVDADGLADPSYTRKEHGVVVLTTHPTGLDDAAPWVEVHWDDGGVVSGVPQMMTMIALRTGWQILSPSRPRPTNGDSR
jgi:hypothetical protein